MKERKNRKQNLPFPVIITEDNREIINLLAVYSGKSIHLTGFNDGVVITKK